MRQSLREVGHEEAEKYFAKARTMFPELAVNGYLEWLKTDIFKND